MIGLIVVFPFSFVFQSGGMAGHTIGIVGDAFFQMNLAHLGIGMGVAVGAGVFHIVAEMAGLAGDWPFVPVIKGEVMGV